VAVDRRQIVILIVFLSTVKTIHLTRPVTVRGLAQALGKKPFQVNKDLISLDFFVEKDVELEDLQTFALAKHYNIRFVVEEAEEKAQG